MNLPTKLLPFFAALAVVAVSHAPARADDPASPAPAGSAAASPAAASYGANLVVNGDAESELGAPDSSTIVKPSGWTTTGQFTSVRYGASGGFPDVNSVGPKDRGKSLFEGGNVVKSTASQTISLAAFAADLAKGKIAYTLSAWLGGFSSQEDNAVVTVTFADATGASLGGATIGPVTAEMRKKTTSSVQVSKVAAVPKAAVSAVVTVVITRVEGTYNDGSADDVKLVLSKPR